MPAKYRVAVIGHTGRGNYGHGVDTVWLQLPQCEIVGVADANEQGLAAAVKRLSAPKGFADYRQLLDEVSPLLGAERDYDPVRDQRFGLMAGLYARNLQFGFLELRRGRIDHRNFDRYLSYYLDNLLRSPGWAQW